MQKGLSIDVATEFTCEALFIHVTIVMPYTSPPLHSFPSCSPVFSLPFNPPISSHILSSSPYTPMRNLPLLLVKNSPAAKMIKRGIRSFCSSSGSTSTLNQRREDGNISCIAAPSQTGSPAENSNVTGSPPTLEQMLLQLELEEAAARRSNMNDYEELLHRRSCVNNADILRTARNALNQHPRFSLDGRDSLYRSTFRNEGGRRPFRCSDFGGRHCMDGYEIDGVRSHGRPSTVGGENVMWCKPGVVARLMGLDMVPVPIGVRCSERRLKRSAMDMRKKDLRRMERLQMESKMVALGLKLHGCKRRAEMEPLGLCSNDHCIMSPAKKFLEPGKSRSGW